MVWRAISSGFVQVSVNNKLPFTKLIKDVPVLQLSAAQKSNALALVKVPSNPAALLEEDDELATLDELELELKTLDELELELKALDELELSELEALDASELLILFDELETAELLSMLDVLLIRLDELLARLARLDALEDEGITTITSELAEDVAADDVLTALDMATELLLTADELDTATLDALETGAMELLLEAKTLELSELDEELVLVLLLLLPLPPHPLSSRLAARHIPIYLIIFSLSLLFLILAIMVSIT